MTLGLQDYLAIAGLFVIVAGLMSTLVISSMRGLARRMEVVEASVVELRKQKADRTEWAREVGRARKSAEAVAEVVTQMDTKLDQNFGVASVGRELVREMARLREGLTNG